MDVLDRATPRLKQAHQLMHEVADICGDEHMVRRLRDAMAANRDAQARLGVIERQVRDVEASRAW